jgi:hypothetical protein
MKKSQNPRKNPRKIPVFGKKVGQIFEQKCELLAKNVNFWGIFRPFLAIFEHF